MDKDINRRSKGHFKYFELLLKYCYRYIFHLRKIEIVALVKKQSR